MPSGLPTLIPDTHAGGLGCRVRRLLLRSQPISTFYSVLYPDTNGSASRVGRTPLQCVPQPPLAIPTRKDSHLISVLHSEQVAIRHQPPTHKRTDERTVFRLWHIVYRPFGQRGYIASGASAYCQATPRNGGLYSQPRTACGSRHGGVGHCRSQVNNKVLSLHKLRDTPLCSLFRLAFQSLFRSVSSTFRNVATMPLAH